MGIQHGSGRRPDTKVNPEGSPLEAYQQYRKDNPVENTKEQAKEITDGKVKPHFIGKKSIEAIKQELISIINSKPDVFVNSVEQNIYFEKLGRILEELKRA